MLRLQLRSCDMRPGRKRTAQVSYQTHPSVLSNSHNLLTNSILDSHNGPSTFGSSTSRFVQVHNFSRVQIRVPIRTGYK